MSRNTEGGASLFAKSSSTTTLTSEANGCKFSFDEFSNNLLQEEIERLCLEYSIGVLGDQEQQTMGLSYSNFQNAARGDFKSILRERAILKDNLSEAFKILTAEKQFSKVGEECAGDKESSVQKDGILEVVGKPDISKENHDFAAILEALGNPVISKEDYDFVAQKFTVADAELRKFIIAEVHKNFKKLYRHEFGSELLSEMAYIPETRADMAHLLTDNVMRCAVDEFGSKFLIACIETNSECFLKEIEKTMVSQSHRLSILKFGSKVVCTWISLRKPQKKLLMPIFKRLREVLKYDYGNEVCLTMLECGYINDDCQKSELKNETPKVSETNTSLDYPAFV